MNGSIERQILKHFLGSIAYRTQKAIRGAPPGYWNFSTGNQARTPIEVFRHMTSLLGYARTFLIEEKYPIHPEALQSVNTEIDRFHRILEDLAQLLESGRPLNEITEQQLLQGPFSDVMTHVGQLALLRRLYGSPIPPENFIYADISGSRLGRNQAEPNRPDKEWPERPTT